MSAHSAASAAKLEELKTKIREVVAHEESQETMCSFLSQWTTAVSSIMSLLFFLWHNAVQGRFILEDARSLTVTFHSRWD